jgi:hypothetical protein
MLRRLLASLGLVAVLAACQQEDADRVAAAVATTTTTTTQPTAPSSTTAAPLEVAVSIHVEGWDDLDPAVYERHRAVVEQLATEAEAAGVTLTFELSRAFAQGTLAAGDGWVASLPGRGQAVGVHADLGATPMPPSQLARRLAEHKALVEEALGAPATHVSGVCSQAPWVEAVIGAGFDAVTGMVEFCMKTLVEVPAGHDALAIAACRTPADCHDPAPADEEHVLHPWRASTSADWITPDPEGELWLIASGPLPAEPSGFAAAVEAAVAARDADRSNSLVLVLSVGERPADGFVTELAASIAHLGDDVRWTSVADLAR